MGLANTYASSFEVTYSVRHLRIRTYVEKGQDRVVLELRCDKKYEPLQVINTSLEEGLEIRKALNSIIKRPYRRRHGKRKTARL